MIRLEREPLITVGLIKDADEVRFRLSGAYQGETDEPFEPGEYRATRDGTSVALTSRRGERFAGAEVRLSPADFDSSRITVEDVTIGVDFHWQRREAQQFQGAVSIRATAEGLTIVNELPLESYLVSVISSEMSASCPGELLRAHAVVSRSWLLAQLSQEKSSRAAPRSPGSSASTSVESGGQDSEESAEIVRWYDRESHSGFDVCADDHCQRYQGISKAFSAEAFEAVRATRGKAVVWGNEICDTRYSKSCGGMTEVYRAAWEEREVPYLTALYDGTDAVGDYQLPLTEEANATAWIRGKPPAFCEADSRELLSRILPGFDQETSDFYRWRVTYSAEELRSIIESRLGIDVGRVQSIAALERGQSGRIVRLKIVGDRRSVTIGKELEIRRALSRSHLYSSAFVVDTEAGDDGRPVRFILTGAGWGHGVGLCQIGAAVMADRGFTHEEILLHYFPGTDLVALY